MGTCKRITESLEYVLFQSSAANFELKRKPRESADAVKVRNIPCARFVLVLEPFWAIIFFEIFLTPTFGFCNIFFGNIHIFGSSL